MVASPRQTEKDEGMATMQWRVQCEKAESAGKWSIANLTKSGLQKKFGNLMKRLVYDVCT